MAAWATHLEFAQFIKNNWSITEGIEENKKILAAKLQEWNKNVFGNIIHRKRRVIARLEGIQRKWSIQPRFDLLKLNKKLQKELEEILLQEEMLWFQRSREEWIISRDRNTRYYNAPTTAKNSSTKISRIRDESNTWIEDKAEILNHITLYFEQLFTEEGLSVDIGH